MRVLFLDMDGVVNSARHFGLEPKDAATGKVSKRSWRRAKGIAKAQAKAKPPIFGSTERNFVNMIFPDTVELLNDITRKTGCAFVLSSSWRVPWHYTAVQRMLEWHGFAGKLVDATPNGIPLPPEIDYERGHEIQAWLDDHPEVTSFAIVDDSDDMAHLVHRLVRTSYERGLERAHADKIIELLQENS